jgi:phosphatidylglycerophosphate synthase
VSSRDEPNSRAATDALLAGLREGRWRSRAWGSFLCRATERSLRQARLRPRALGEVTLLHAALATLSARKARLWTVTSWALCAAHLGMLQQRQSIGCANVITIIRGNLPMLSSAWWSPVLALTSELADGRVARATGTESPFGASADSLADAAFWAWFALRHETSRRARVAALLAWVLTVLAITASSVGSGRMIDAPRPALVRPAAALQAILTVRAVFRTVRTGNDQRCCRLGDSARKA